MSEEVKQFQSENNVEIVGVLVSYEFKDILTKKDKIPMKIGNLKVRSAEGETHTVQMMAMKWYKRDMEKSEDKRDIQGGFKAIETIENEYISEEETKSDSSEHVGKTPSEVRVRGNLEPNIFKTKAGQEVKDIRIQGRFVNRLNVSEDVPHQAIVRLSGFVGADPIPEVGKDGEETGRYKLDLRVIDYQNKAVPIDLFAGKVTDDDGGEVDAGEWIADNYEKGQTVTVDADIVNRYIVKEVEREGGGFGKKMVDTKRDVLRERAIFSGTEPLDFDDFDEDNNADREKVVFPDQMKEAIENYDTYVADQLAQAEKRNEANSDDKPATGKRGAMGSGGASKGGSKKSAKDKLDSLPF